jgi:hypothetical protein
MKCADGRWTHLPLILVCEVVYLQGSMLCCPLSHILFRLFSTAFLCMLLLVLFCPGLDCLRIAGESQVNRCGISVCDIIPMEAGAGSLATNVDTLCNCEPLQFATFLRLSRVGKFSPLRRKFHYEGLYDMYPDPILLVWLNQKGEMGRGEEKIHAQFWL